MSTCQADCFLDQGAIRPLKSPRQLVWMYFQINGLGELESRQFTNCPCGCGNLVANPPALLREHASLLAPKIPVSTESEVAPSDHVEVHMSSTAHWLLRFAAVVVILVLIYYRN